MNKRKVLIIGIAGGLAQILARLLVENFDDLEVIGIDTRDLKNNLNLENVHTQKMRYSRGNFEKLFRDHEFFCVYHLARISQAGNSAHDLEKRLELNLMGTNRILDLCLRFKVKKVVVMSTFHVYGALAENSVFLSENAPLKASIKYPELRDVVELDQISTNWMWKFQSEIETIVLRPCNIVGRQINNAMSRYLSSKVALSPIDFNPMFQFIHEFDMARVLLSCMDKIKTGIYNVASDDFISLRDAHNILGVKKIPFVMSTGHIVNSLISKFGLNIPGYFIDYLRYSCLISNKTIAKELPENFFRFKIEDTLKLLKLR